MRGRRVRALDRLNRRHPWRRRRGRDGNWRRHVNSEIRAWHFEILDLSVGSMNFDRLGIAIAAANDNTAALNTDALLKPLGEAFGGGGLTLSHRLSTRFVPLALTLAADF